MGASSYGMTGRSLTGVIGEREISLSSLSELAVSLFLELIDPGFEVVDRFKQKDGVTVAVLSGTLEESSGVVFESVDPFVVIFYLSMSGSSNVKEGREHDDKTDHDNRGNPSLHRLSSIRPGIGHYRKRWMKNDN